MAMPLFHGSIVALITPMTHGEVNYEELKKLVAECQKVGSELYDQGLIKPYDPIR